MTVEEAVLQLEEAIRKSDIYRAYQKANSRVDEREGLREQINAFRAASYELQRQGNTADFLDRLEAFEEKYESFREDPMVEDFLSAELAYCRMMQEIEIRLAEAADFE